LESRFDADVTMARVWLWRKLDVSNRAAMPDIPIIVAVSCPPIPFVPATGLFSQRSAVLQDCLLLILGELLVRRHLARAFSDNLQ